MLVDLSSKKDKQSSFSKRVDKQQISEARLIAIEECRSLKQIMDVVSYEINKFAISESSDFGTKLSLSGSAFIEKTLDLLDGKTPEGMIKAEADIERLRLFSNILKRINNT